VTSRTVVSSGRTVTLVVRCDGSLVGATEPFEVETPWWMDIEPIAKRFPGIAVLRMLEADPAPDHVMGGRVTYLVEPLDRSSTTLECLRPLHRWDGELDDDPLRMPWARPGGPRADLDWAMEQVSSAGDPRQHRTWNLSSIWSLPTRDGRVWLKCVPPFFSHEAVVLTLLSEQRVPRLLAADDHRMLLADLPGEEAYLASVESRRTLIDLLIHLQVSTIGRIEEFEAAGVPDGRLAALVAAAEAVVLRRAPEDRVLRELVDGAAERVAAIVECGLPDVLVHGDAHGGNARIGPGADPGIWFDWGDSRIGHPILDVGVLLRPGHQHGPELIEHWLDGWKRSVPGSDPHRAWELVRPLAVLNEAVVYQGFLDRIEATERPYHVNDVLPRLAGAAELAAS